MTTVQLDTKKLPTSSKELSYPVPTNIHLIWVAPLPKAVQCERIKEWAHKKSNVTVYLWVDSKLFDTGNRNELDSSEISLTDNLSNKTKECASRAKVNSNLRRFPPTMGAQGYYHTGGVISDLKRFNELVTNLQVLSNIQVKDLSDRHDIRLMNRNAYQYQRTKRDTAVALKIVRDDILHQYGGVCVDVALLT
ncbi:hypothetical protein AB4179_24155 [Vibrio lentus]|uniref:hypothetical protein n=3 Tax=Vibrio TaxID=662 RepID=UPI00246938B8|nr:hypothetical protein [Vibrio lentus]MDH5928708.1 hypothetical protein [Vibrio lentus]